MAFQQSGGHSGDPDRAGSDLCIWHPGSIREFYYSSVRSTILAQSSVITSQLTSYAEDSSAVFASQVRTLVENFQERERMELMAIDINGKITK